MLLLVQLEQLPIFDRWCEFRESFMPFPDVMIDFSDRDFKVVFEERFDAYFKHPEPHHHVLRVGDTAWACANVRHALATLGVAREFGPLPLLFDEPLHDAVLKFQVASNNRNRDGAVGPGTRYKLIQALLSQGGVKAFSELDRTDVARPPTIFLSYAQTDQRMVDELHAWLRKREIHVIRDVDDFLPGSNIPKNVWKSILRSDKVVAIYSEASSQRDWPTFEHEISRQVENFLKTPVLIFVRIDGTPLKLGDPHRIAINGRPGDGKSGFDLSHIGSEILRSFGLST